MIEARVYRGIEFVRISELPDDQKSLIKKWAVNGTVIKILMEKTLLSDCIQYKDYSYWFENIYQATKEIEMQPTVEKKRATSIKLAIGR